MIGKIRGGVQYRGRHAFAARAELDLTRYVLVQNPSHYDEPCGFVVTDAGRNAHLSVETCDCADLLVFDGAYQCRVCGTVYGLVYGFSVIRAKARRQRRVS